MDKKNIIDDLLSIIPSDYVPNRKIRTDLYIGNDKQEIKSALTKQLQKSKVEELDKTELQTLKHELERQYNQARIAPGEPVGIKTSSAISAPTMQMTLNTFHSAGAKANVSLNFPAYKEIINGSKVPKNSNMTIYFEKKGMKIDEVMRFGLKHIKYQKIKDLLLSNPRVINIKEEIKQWHNIALLYSPQYEDIIPSREELIQMLAHNKHTRDIIMKKMHA